MQTRGRGGKGGWVWRVHCPCGWQSWRAPSKDDALEQWGDHKIKADDESPVMKIKKVTFWTSILGDTFVGLD